MNANFSEIAMTFAQVQPGIVDQISLPSPLIASAGFQETTHGFRHAYQELESVTGASRTNLNAAYSSVGADFVLKNKDIDLYAGRHEVHVNTAAAFGSAQNYFQKKLTYIETSTLSSVDVDVIYNQMEKVCQDFGTQTKYVTSGSDFYSLRIVRWEEDVMSMLFNPTGFGRGSMVQVKPLSNGDRYVNSSGKSVYGADLELTVGLLAASKRNIGSIVNLKLAAIDTAFGQALSDKLADLYVGTGGRTVVYGHPKAINRITKLLEAEKASIANSGILVNVWNQVQFIGDYNFIDGTEALIS